METRMQERGTEVQMSI